MSTEPTKEMPTAPPMLAMSMEQLQMLIASLPASSPGAGLTAEALAEILKSNRTEQENRRAVRHSNADHEHVSVFSYPEGDLKRPKQKLARETFFNNHRVTEDEVTPLEVDCYNAIDATCSARDGRWEAIVDQGGRRLRVSVPSFTPDDRSDLPSTVEILMELAQGTKAVSRLDMIARIAELERIVKKHQGSAIEQTGFDREAANMGA